MIMLAVGIVGYLSMRFSFAYENKRRARIVAGWTDEQLEEEQIYPNRRGHQKLTFVYGT
jgi:hypothetical protein